MRVGYLPDMFGHIAQMPQILRAFGIDNAVVWRGVPSVVDGHRFEWRGIDGSTVMPSTSRRDTATARTSCSPPTPRRSGR